MIQYNPSVLPDESLDILIELDSHLGHRYRPLFRKLKNIAYHEKVCREKGEVSDPVIVLFQSDLEGEHAGRMAAAVEAATDAVRARLETPGTLERDQVLAYAAVRDFLRHLDESIRFDSTARPAPPARDGSRLH